MPPPLRPRPALALSALVALAACDTAGRTLAAPAGPDPLALDYDAVESLDYDGYVRPLLAARGVLGSTDPAAYAHQDVVMAGPSGFVVPFDAEGSLMLRFVEDLPADAEIPFPNLRLLDSDERRYLARWIEDGARGPARTAPAPRPAPAPQRPAAPAIDTAALAAHAAAQSSRRPATAAPRTIAAAPSPASSPPTPPAIPMPDLGDSADRLRAVLAEIEEAAARARARTRS